MWAPGWALQPLEQASDRPRWEVWAQEKAALRGDAAEDQKVCWGPDQPLPGDRLPEAAVLRESVQRGQERVPVLRPLEVELEPRAVGWCLPEKEYWQEVA